MNNIINSFNKLTISNEKIKKIIDNDFDKIVKKYFSNYFDISPIINYSYLEKNLTNAEINQLINYLNKKYCL